MLQLRNVPAIPRQVFLGSRGPNHLDSLQLHAHAPHLMERTCDRISGTLLNHLQVPEGTVFQLQQYTHNQDASTSGRRLLQDDLQEPRLTADGRVAVNLTSPGGYYYLTGSLTLTNVALQGVLPFLHGASFVHGYHCCSSHKSLQSSWRHSV